MTAKQKGILLTTLITPFIGMLMASSLNLSITDISTDFDCGATTVSWIVNLFTIVNAVLYIPLGHLGDIADRRRLYLIGIIIFSAAGFACAVTTSIYWLIGIRVIQAIGASMTMTVSVPLMIAAFPAERRGRILGYSVTAVYVGMSLGPVFGGLLNDRFGWRSIFLIGALLNLICLYPTWKYVDREERREGAGSDDLGNILCVLMLTALLLGLSLIGDVWWAKVLIVAGLALIVCFVLWERKAKHPAVQVSLFASSPGYTLSNIAALLDYGATFALSYTLSIYLQNVSGFASATAGLILIAQPVVQAFVSPVAGRMSDRYSPNRIAALGMVIISAGLFMLGHLSVHSSVWFVIVALMVVGLGHAMFASPNNNYIVSCVDSAHVGEANAILGTMRTLGMSISMVIIVVIMGQVMGNVVIATAPAASISTAVSISMLVYAGICLVGAVFSLVGSKKEQA